MRILMLTQWFDPEPAFKGLAFARELVGLGHDVEILTGFPNYPGGRLYPGYNVKPLQREVIDGISIIRVPLYPSHDGSSLKRILNYVSFAVSAALLGPFLVKPADVMYVYHPPATVGFPAMVINFLRGIPFVYDIQDLWPDTLASTGMLTNRFVLYCVRVWCKFVYNRANHLVVLSPGFKRALTERGVIAEKVSVIYNWCDEAQLRQGLVSEEIKKEPGMVGRFNVLFAGTMGKAQALDAVLKAADIIAVHNPAVQFVFVGGGIDVDRLKHKVQEENLKNVLFLLRRPTNEMGAVFALADVLLVHLKDDPLFAITIPSKIQAYMSSGRPILLGVRGDAADLLGKSGAGLLCEPENPASIALGVERFFLMSQEKRAEIGKHGKLFYERELSLTVGVKRFNDIFRMVAGHA